MANEPMMIEEPLVSFVCHSRNPATDLAPVS